MCMATVNDLELALSQASMTGRSDMATGGTTRLRGSLTIGEGARQAGVAATPLRYYEQIGLGPAPARLGGQRRYDDSVLARLEVIRLCKSAGFALDEIEALFADDAPGRPASRALAE